MSDSPNALELAEFHIARAESAVGWDAKNPEAALAQAYAMLALNDTLTVIADRLEDLAQAGATPTVNIIKSTAFSEDSFTAFGEFLAAKAEAVETARAKAGASGDAVVVATQQDDAGG